MLYIYLRNQYPIYKCHKNPLIGFVTNYTGYPKYFPYSTLLIYDKGSSWENLIRENPKFKALFNSTISKELFNQESQLVNYISLQMKYIHKEIFSILLKESQFFLNPKHLLKLATFLQVMILFFYTVCAFLYVIWISLKKTKKKH